MTTHKCHMTFTDPSVIGHMVFLMRTWCLSNLLWSLVMYILDYSFEACCSQSLLPFTPRLAVVCSYM